MGAIGRNEPCPCGSGLKYKRCCALKSNKMPLSSRVVISVVGTMLAIGAIVVILSLTRGGEEGAGAVRVWSEEHGHYHYQ